MIPVRLEKTDEFQRKSKGSPKGSNNYRSYVPEEVWKLNETVRKSQDWLKIPGVVSENKKTKDSNMRIALFSDIHGNDLALEAVLNDIAQLGGVDEYWVLGDLVALGPAPEKVLEMLKNLPSASVVRGNTDRYVFSGTDRPPPSIEEASLDTSKIPTLVDCAGTFAWTQGALSVNNWNTWLEHLPLEIRKELPDGTRVLGVHAAPGKDDGYGIHPGRSHEVLLSAFESCNANLVFGGHHHMSLDKRIGDLHLVNLGCVSNPYAPDLRASYVLLECDESGYHVTHKRVDYDREPVIQQMRNLRLPGSQYVIDHLSGKRKFPEN